MAEKRGTGYLVAGVILALILVLFSFSYCRREEAQPPPPEVEEVGGKLIIALLPEQNVFAQKQRYAPLGEYLSDKLRRSVEFKLLDSYGAIMEEIIGKEVDGAFFGSLNFTLTYSQAGVEPLARPLWLNGESTYAGYIFTRKDSGLTEDVAGWKGKTFSFVHTATTAGYVFPLGYLSEHGVKEPGDFFSRTYFAGSHDASALAVYNGEADLGAGKNHIYNRLKDENPDFGENMVILAESKAVPSNGLAVRPGLDGELKKELKEALLGMHLDPWGQKTLSTFGAQKIIETNVTDYSPVMDLAERAGLDLANYPLTREYTPFSSPQLPKEN